MLRQAVLGSKFQNLFFLLLPFARRTAQEKIRFYATLSQTLNFAPAPISEPPPPLSRVHCFKSLTDFSEQLKVYRYAL